MIYCVYVLLCIIPIWSTDLNEEAWSWRHLESGLRESSEFVKQQLAEENAAWRHIVTFVFGNEENNVKEKYVQNRGAECCTTSRSGRWCRRSQPGHLHLATFQGHHHQQVVKNRNDLNHDATNWTKQLYASTDWSCQFDEKMLLRSEESDIQVTDVMNYVSDLPAIFSVLLNFGLSDTHQFLISMMDYSNQKTCQYRYVWDPFSSECQPAYCSPSAYKNYMAPDDCFPSNNSNKDYLNKFIFEMDVVHLTIYANIYFNDTFQLDIIRQEFASKFTSFFSIDEARLSELSVDCLENCSLVNQTASVAISFDLSGASESSDEPSIDTIVAKITSLIEDHLMTIWCGMYVRFVGIKEEPSETNVDTFNNWCRGGIEATYVDDEFMIYVDNNASECACPMKHKVYIKPTQTWYEPGEFMANLLFGGQAGFSVTNVTGYVVVCENRSVILDPNCRAVRLNWSDVIYYEDRSIVYYGLDLVNWTFYAGQYESLPNGQVAICIEESEPPFSLLWTIASYVSTILDSISLLAMVATMMTYIIFCELRNLPGMAIFNLTLSTFCFHLTFILGMRQSVYAMHTLCMVVALGTHYWGLASSLWTNVIAWDLYGTFSRRINATPRSVAKMLPRYALYAYGLPLLIVTISAGIDYCDCSVFDPGYGQTICWMSNSLANFLFFGLPMIMALIVNFALFVTTIASIRHVSGSLRNYERSSRKQTALSQVKLYARMCTVLGFTWVFGLISSCMPTYPMAVIFGFLFTVTNALGGLFIFVAFICNRRVRVLYARLWHKLSGSTAANSKDSITSPNASQANLKTISAETMANSTQSTLDSSPNADGGSPKP